METDIRSFLAEYAFLSNFFWLPAPILYEGLAYPTVEHAYQAQKTLDPLKRLAISHYYYPESAKRAGGNLQLRPGWDQMKDEIMLDLLELKFAHPDLRRLLEATGDRDLIEGNRYHDNYWGHCYCQTSRCCDQLPRNMLGKLLMMVRASLCDHQPSKLLTSESGQ